MRSHTLILILFTVMATMSCQTANHAKAPQNDALEDLGGEQWRVRLSWQTETEMNAFGFYIHRADSPEGETRVINASSPVHAAGTTTIPQRYRYYDLDVEPGKTYYYKLEQVDVDGSSQIIIGADGLVPGEARPLTAEERDEIRLKGTMFRDEATNQARI